MKPYSTIPTAKCERMDAGTRWFQTATLYVVVIASYAMLRAIPFIGVEDWMSGPHIDNNFDVLVIDLLAFPLIFTWACMMLVSSNQKNDQVFAFGVVFWGLEFVSALVLSFFDLSSQQAFIFLGLAIAVGTAFTHRCVKKCVLISTMMVVITQSAFAIFAFDPNLALIASVGLPLCVFAFSSTPFVSSYKTSGQLLLSDWSRLAIAWSAYSIAMMLLDMTWVF